MPEIVTEVSLPETFEKVPLPYPVEAPLPEPLEEAVPVPEPVEEEEFLPLPVEAEMPETIEQAPPLDISTDEEEQVEEEAAEVVTEVHQDNGAEDEELDGGENEDY